MEGVTINEHESITAESSAVGNTPQVICKFYSEGKCRFGDECHNLHQGPVKPKDSNVSSKKSKCNGKSAKRSGDEIDGDSGKKPMKTASDVIKRIQWDEMLAPEFFSIGYLDRFTGIVEDPFTKFTNWGDIVSIYYL